MSSSFSGDPNNFISESQILPDLQAEDYHYRLVRYLNDISVATNTKDSGFYVEDEIITGQNFIPIYGNTESSNAQYRDVFRKVIDFGALPNAASKSVAHGISTTQNYSIVKLYGAATDPGVSTITMGIPIPFINVTTPADSVQLEIDPTNIIITTTTANYTAYTRCFVVVEYIKVV